MHIHNKPVGFTTSRNMLCPSAALAGFASFETSLVQQFSTSSTEASGLIRGEFSYPSLLLDVIPQ